MHNRRNFVSLKYLLNLNIKSSAVNIMRFWSDWDFCVFRHLRTIKEQAQRQNKLQSIFLLISKSVNIRDYYETCLKTNYSRSTYWYVIQLRYLIHAAFKDSKHIIPKSESAPLALRNVHTIMDILPSSRFPMV